MTKQGKTSVCKTDNFVPLVVSRLSTSSGSNSSSTSTSQDLSSTSPAQERSDGLVPREWCGSPNKNIKRDGSRDADDRLRDLPESLEEFTDHLEDAEVHALAHISQGSDSERLAKVVSKSRKHSILDSAKQRLHRRRKRVYESSSRRNTNQKSFTPTTHWNLAELVKIFHGIIARLHHIDQRLMELLKEQCAD